jgi:hypothetical protein
MIAIGSDHGGVELRTTSSPGFVPGVPGSHIENSQIEK